jgi:phosphoenolpyruvate carboxykinase (GTP)
MKSNPNALIACRANSLFTNVGLTDDGDVYWEGMDVMPEGNLTDWKRRPHWRPTLVPDFKGGYKVNDKVDPCAQSNSRFTAPLMQCPVLDPEWNNPQGVPISAILFGGRRDDTMPLIFQSRDWAHGTYFGAVMRSQATTASDQVGLVNDPMAMKPFIGYNVKDYWAHWLTMGERGGDKMPKIFNVNWFRKDAAGKFIWPGFGENARVLEWVFNRCNNAAEAIETPIGFVPAAGSMNLDGIDVDEAAFQQLTAINKEKWANETEAAKTYLNSLMVTDSTPLPAKFLEINAELETAFKA